MGRHDRHVLVRVGDRSWTVGPDEELDFGRGRERAIRLGHDPEDRYVSRRAGTLLVQDSYVLVRNDSATQALDLVPPAGPGRRVEPGEATTSLPHPRFAVVVVGGYGHRYGIEVDAGRLSPPARPPEVPADRGVPDTVAAAVPLTAAQHRLLTALCEPLLRPGAGPPAGPASYRQVGVLLDRQPGYVRNVLKEVRETLTAAGVPGLVPADGPGADADFRLPLALWALRTGTVTRAHLDRLGPPDPR